MAAKVLRRAMSEVMLPMRALSWFSMKFVRTVASLQVDASEFMVLARLEMEPSDDLKALTALGCIT